MKIFVPKEINNEKRVAASPDTVKKFVDLGHSVVIEPGAGNQSNFGDDSYSEAGASIANEASSADIILKVGKPSTDEISTYKDDSILIAMLDPFNNRDLIDQLRNKNITAFAMEWMPRITRAQSMDVLSSQSNLAGYKAVIEASNSFNKAMPMMMTAAGTIAPAKVMVFGAGVAGLQAIATAKRLGAVVSATDVRLAAKEQVESLGGKFLVVEGSENLETDGGYAKEVSEEFKKNNMYKNTINYPSRMGMKAYLKYEWLYQLRQIIRKFPQTNFRFINRREYIEANHFLPGYFDQANIKVGIYADLRRWVDGKRDDIKWMKL